QKPMPSPMHNLFDCDGSNIALPVWKNGSFFASHGMSLATRLILPLKGKPCSPSQVDPPVSVWLTLPPSSRSTMRCALDDALAGSGAIAWIGSLIVALRFVQAF